MTTETEELAFFDVVQTIVADQLGLPKSDIKPESNFTEELKADSLDLVELVMALEENFVSPEGTELEISDEETEKIITVKDICLFLQEKQAQPKE